MPSWIRSVSGTSWPAVVLGDRDHEAQVRVDHPLLGVEVAALDALRELDLLVGGEQAVPADLVQEQLQGVGFEQGLTGHKYSYCPCSTCETGTPRDRVITTMGAMPALSPPVMPQLALSRVALPEGEEWSYEPKWDGFRALAFVDGTRTSCSRATASR